MDLRLDLDAFLKKWGQNVYLQRRKTPFVDTPDGCAKYNNVLEKHTVRTMNVAASRALGAIKQEETEGIEYPVEMVFWFRYDVNPISGDRVYMQVPRYPSGKDPVYELDFADPKYGFQGRIEFWAAAGTKIRPE